LLSHTDSAASARTSLNEPRAASRDAASANAPTIVEPDPSSPPIARRRSRDGVSTHAARHALEHRLFEVVDEQLAIAQRIEIAQTLDADRGENFRSIPKASPVLTRASGTTAVARFRRDRATVSALAPSRRVCRSADEKKGDVRSEAQRDVRTRRAERGEVAAASDDPPPSPPPCGMPSADESPPLRIDRTRSAEHEVRFVDGDCRMSHVSERRSESEKVSVSCSEMV